MSVFSEFLSLIVDGQNVDAATANAPLQELLANTVWLRDRVAAMIESQALFLRDVTVISSAGIGQPVYWNSGNSRYELALADGTVKQNVVGLIYSKNGSTQADLVLVGYTDVDLAVPVGGAPAATRYWLSPSVAGMFVGSQPGAGFAVNICLSLGNGFAVVLLQNQNNIGPQGSQGNQGVQGNQGFQGLGVQGFQGLVGGQGSQGGIGAQGRQGYQGSVGGQGAKGFQGNQG